ncbi:MAG: hypothetical protein DSY37_04045 [Hyperthermus sp.]|nr:MAG: hypothetical protein DSY37_04045 [Hyperthermus sp.]
MSEEEAAVEEAATSTQEEEPEEVIDINAALLEIMVKRTDILERLMRGEIEAGEVVERLESIKMPSVRRRKRRA